MKDFIKFVQDYLLKPVIEPEQIEFNVYNHKKQTTINCKIEKDPAETTLPVAIDIDKILYNFKYDINTIQKTKEKKITPVLLAYFEKPLQIIYTLTYAGNIITFLDEKEIITDYKNTKYKPKILDFIASSPSGKSKSELTVNFHNIKIEARDQLIKELLDDNQIICSIDTSAGRQKRMYKINE